jgi:hypothetical protein
VTFLLVNDHHSTRESLPRLVVLKGCIAVNFQAMKRNTSVDDSEMMLKKTLRAQRICNTSRGHGRRLRRRAAANVYFEFVRVTHFAWRASRGRRSADFAADGRRSASFPWQLVRFGWATTSFGMCGSISGCRSSRLGRLSTGGKRRKSIGSEHGIYPNLVRRGISAGVWASVLPHLRQQHH